MDFLGNPIFCLILHLFFIKPPNPSLLWQLSIFLCIYASISLLFVKLFFHCSQFTIMFSLNLTSCLSMPSKLAERNSWLETIGTGKIMNSE